MKSTSWTASNTTAFTNGHLPDIKPKQILSQYQRGGAMKPIVLHEIGDLIAEVYEVQDIFRGGMGEVYICKETNSINRDELVVLKTFISDSTDPAYTKYHDRFLREAEAWFRVGKAHPDSDWFLLGLTGTVIHNGRPYLKMTYCPRGNLRHRITENKMSIDDKIIIATQILIGMKKLNDDYKIIHRDLKPDNILFNRHDHVLISDLGIAKFYCDSDSSVNIPDNFITLTECNQFIGTLPYAAPEQLLGSPVDNGIDIWAFGVVLFQLLTGDFPFFGMSSHELAGRILHFEPTGLVNIKKHYGTALYNIIKRCLEKDRDNRYTNFTEMFTDWDKIIKLNSSPPKTGWIKRDERIFIDDFRVEREWLSVFKDRINPKGEFLLSVNQSAANRTTEAESLMNIGKFKLALESLKMVLFTTVNGNNNLEKFLNHELTDEIKIVDWNERLAPNLICSYLVPPKPLIEIAIYRTLSCYMHLCETPSMEAVDEVERNTLLHEFIDLCDQLSACEQLSSSLAILCAEGYNLVGQYSKSLSMLSHIITDTSPNAKAAAVYWYAACKSFSEHDLDRCAGDLLYKYVKIDEYHSAYLCARIYVHYSVTKRIIEFSRKALKFNPQNFQLLFWLSLSLINDSQYDEADKIYQDMKMRLPKHDYVKYLEDKLISSRQ